MELTEEYKLKIEKRINSFSESYMNNSKWKKVFNELLKHRKDIEKCEIVDFYYSGINEINWIKINTESSQFITQTYIASDITTSEYPTFYKGIEYLEFPKYWIENTKFKLVDNKKTVTQNTEKIKELLSKIGKFMWEENNETLKLIGYKND